MTEGDEKDLFLLEQLEGWWNCIQSQEIIEGLGQAGLSPEKKAEIQKFYPKFFSGLAADQGDAVEDIRTGMKTLFTRIYEMISDA